MLLLLAIERHTIKPSHGRRGNRMKRITVLLSTVAVLTLVGCTARINKLMASWEGHHYSNLIASWGPPQQVFDDGAGGRILVYTAVRSYTVPGQATTYTTGSATAYNSMIWGSATSRTTYTPAQTYGWTAYRMFWIRRNGIIYRWAWRGT